MLRTAAKATFLATALPLYVLYRLVRDLTYGTSHPAWGYRTSVLCACGQFCSSFLTSPKTPIEKPLNMPPPNFPAKILKASRIAHFFVGKGTVVTPRIAPAVKRELLKGTALVGGEHVQPVAVPVFWVIKSGQAETTDNAEEGEKVILYLAGGGTHPTLSPTPYDLARETGVRVLALAFRPAPFPTPLIDPFAGFRMLLGAGFDPKNILVVGESAGAFAVLALVRYLKELRDEYGIDAGMPGGIAVISPACNMARFNHPVVETDFRLPHYRRRLTPRLAYHYPLDEIIDSPYFNPAHAPSGAHTGLPATFLQFGSGEIFADDIRVLADGMIRDGVKLEVDEIEGGLHTEGNIKRALGKKAACWKRMMAAIREMGWST